MTHVNVSPAQHLRAPNSSRLVPTADWRPIEIDDLEPTAWDALRDCGNVAVVAGPGAGKTEFLAQRAAYLLQTGICPWPHRILAISFKRDAAANLRRRVTTRVPDHAERFVSMTFDAFTKGLLDRFSPALPADWRKKEDYEIRYATDSDVSRFLNDTATVAPVALRYHIAALQSAKFLANIVGGHELPKSAWAEDPADPVEYAVRAWWSARYLREGSAYVDFVMINRLSELIVRSAPQLRRALRVTYPFVFIDEFQDTTSAQFSFVESVFGNGNGPTVTAVGDSKQRIMGWAGALPRAVERFTTTFAATSYPLAWNFRSSDELVQLQHVVASALDTQSLPAISKAIAEVGHDPAVIWQFPNASREATFIADWIARDIAASGRVPADFALLARQKIAEFEPLFRAGLALHGIGVRNDDEAVGKMRLQDLLKHDATRLLLGLFRLAAEPRGLATVWREVSAILTRIDGAMDDDLALRQVGEKLAEITNSLRSWLKLNPPTKDSVEEAVCYLLDLIDREALHRYVKAVTPGEELDVVIDAFNARIANVAEAGGLWAEVFERFEASQAVVLLTAHRSKSLEYHTVFFLGLDDQQWWSHERNRSESISTFFVGLSRAAHRLIFTTTTTLARTGKIADLFKMLDAAGVPEIVHK
ncbi:UvrD-helicase domain-containing protein [Nocardia alni]|uniref:UvrD-helicase domain-containing protein n=1 Tax=Nocardia alni TaxID=2815723 RepID=UPI001C2399D1|nr:ATP-dependent helicase [Nocardia alni]